MTFGECRDCGSLNKIENQYLMLCAGCAHARRKAERQASKVKVVAPIKKITAKRANQNLQYAKLRKQYLEAYPACEVENCNNKSSEIHHQKGRSNEMLTDTNYFMAVCKSCHHKITIDSQWAIKNGYSIIRSV
jgi:hypothetical protein